MMQPSSAEVRWKSLTVPSSGQTGFTLLPAVETGLTFTNNLDEAASAHNRILENGSGVAIGDFDGDGRPDVFLCSLTGRNALYRNLGDWKFEDVTAAAGVVATNYVCRGAVFADLNGDGWLDLLISTLGRGVLCFMNDGAGHFHNTTQSAGTETQFGSMTLALADVDGNGTLDLYVANYRAEDIRDRGRIEIQRAQGQIILAPALRDRLILSKDGVREFGEPDLLYLNDGHGHFSPVAWTGGAFRDEEGRPLAGAPADWGLTASFRDINGDGLPDLYVCNDYWTPDRLWINQGHGQFRAAPRYALRHTSENSMGVDFADIDRDGNVDFLVLDMLSPDPALRKRQELAQTRMPPAVGDVLSRPQIMRNTLFHNRGDGTFEEIADFAALPASEWSWQPLFVDVDLDGFEDVLIPAGHRRDVQDLDATARIRSLQHPWPKGMDPQAQQQAFTREMLEHSRLYPALEKPVLAFRNTGQLRFEDKTKEWGTADLGVHQGIALADLDGDGDLDFVVNNLNGVCGVYRNDCTAPRVAVRLNGAAPNTQAIGAKVTLRGGAVAVQTQEMVCGGRYLSGCEGLLVFAAGSAAGGMTLQVRWRSGKETLVERVAPNRLYEIDEPRGNGASSEIPSARPSESAPQPRPLFEDVTARLNHVHMENDFDDFVRQPLLPRKLSQLGPGLAWADLDGDGHDDLVIGSGGGGALTIWRGDGAGAFRQLTNATPVCIRDQSGLVVVDSPGHGKVILAGSANYEQESSPGASCDEFDSTGSPLTGAITGAASSTGPLAVADFDGNGRLALFIGGRVLPGRYPEPASSMLLRQEAGAWRLDAPNTGVLAKVGLVSGAVWGDLDGDGYPELILACEWGPLRVFKNRAGRLEEITGALGLDGYTGWWAGVSTGDFDGDGRLDLAAANWGLNSMYHASAAQPLRLFYGDFMGRGTVDVLETEYDSLRHQLAPLRRLDALTVGLPYLQERFSSHRAFAESSLDEVLAERRSRAFELSCTTLASMVFLNRGDHFEPLELPREAQFAPAFGVTVADFDGDGDEDIFLTQNFFDLPLDSPRQDAGRGLLLRGDGTGHFQAMPGQFSGIQIYGEQRGAAMADFNEDGRVDLAVGQNGAAARLFSNTGARPGLRVRLRGPPGNPTGIGTVVRLRFGQKWGPAREVHAGSGYWSQDSAVPVLSTPEAPTGVWVRWPGGRITNQPIPNGAKEALVQWVN
jgi:hypothetical protein